MNKAFLIGRITKDLELRSTSTGKSICDFSLAINRRAVKDGEKITDFINCRAWNKTAENLTKYQKKGNLIAVSGRIQVDSYQDKDGKTRYNTYVLVEELEFLETKKEKNEFNDLKASTGVKQEFDYIDEELPF